MAVSVVPNAVTMMVGRVPSIFFISLKVSSPFMPGRRTSRITRSRGVVLTISTPASPEAADTTS